jgi:hypothetical protein
MVVKAEKIEKWKEDRGVRRGIKRNETSGGAAGYNAGSTAGRSIPLGGAIGNSSNNHLKG